MIEQERLPLENNTNIANIPTTPDENGNACANSQSLDIKQVLSNLAKCAINDENSDLTNTHAASEIEVPIKPVDEVAALRAELAATRRKLEEYEERSVPPPSEQPVRFRYRSTSRNHIPSADAVLPFARNDVHVWTDKDTSQAESSSTQSDSVRPTPPAQSPCDTPPFSFKPPDLGTSIGTGVSNPNYGLDLESSTGVKREHRSFTVPAQDPIGEPRRQPGYKRSASEEHHKILPGGEPWKAEQEWNPSTWQTLSTSPSRQLTGTASLGLVYNDESLWTNVCSKVDYIDP